jgi:hypothetical protein
MPFLLSFARDFLRLFIWLVLLMMIFIPLEKISALHPRKVFRKAFLPDLAYYFLNNLLLPLLLVVPMSLVGVALHFVLPRGLQAQAAGLPAAGRAGCRRNRLLLGTSLVARDSVFVALP